MERWLASTVASFQLLLSPGEPGKDTMAEDPTNAVTAAAAGRCRHVEAWYGTVR